MTLPIRQICCNCVSLLSCVTFNTYLSPECIRTLLPPTSLMLQSCCFHFSLVDGCVCFCACIPSYPTTLTSPCPCAVFIEQYKDQHWWQHYDLVRMRARERRKRTSTIIHIHTRAYLHCTCMPGCQHFCMRLSRPISFSRTASCLFFLVAFPSILLWVSLDRVSLYCLPQHGCRQCKQRRQQVLFVSSACSLC